MSEAARRDLALKRHWAEPGSRHDRLVRVSKFVLPILIGGLLVVLAVAPFDRRGDVSFILDKNKVDAAQERMRVEAARYTGTDDKGQKFSIDADRAIQPTSDRPIVDIEGMRAQLELERGPLSIVAGKGRYDLDQQKVAIDGPVRVAGPDGYRLETSDVGIDLKNRNLASRGRVVGDMRLGHFEAGRMTANLGTREVVLTDGVSLKIRQGAVR
ncbi:MAG: LPS export ABC transporter periplasmic protein LptC [Pseudomonadota bacterium]|nr:LPS export ABC transporter periplasmic protein LptC [Pseudomonadota bacterium]